MLEAPDVDKSTTQKARVKAAWWWIDRWRKSTAYTDMTLEERGAYRELLDELWLREGVIPNDERILARIVGDAKAWKRVRPAVLARFKVTPEGLRNDTHDEIQAESQQRAERQQRYRNKARNVTPSPSPSPSPLTSNVNTPADTRARGRKDGDNGATDALMGPGGRVAREREVLALVTEGAQLMNLDPAEVMAKGKHYRDGAPTGGFNPASWSPDRLLNTVLDLRELVRLARAKAAAAQPLGRG